MLSEGSVTLKFNYQFSQKGDLFHEFYKKVTNDIG